MGAEIYTNNFRKLCPLVRKHGFLVKTSDGKMLLINPELNSEAFDVGKNTTRWEGPKKLNPKDFAWNIREYVCANAMHGCEYFDHAKENSIHARQPVKKGMCMPIVVNSANVATLEVELSS